MNRLSGKVAIVTGSSSGIGAGTAKLFAEEGAKVVLTARREHRLEALAEEIRAAGGEALVVPGDCTVLADCVRVVETAIEKYGCIDILVNNAGIGDKHRPTTKCDEEWWDHVCNTDLKSVYYFTREVLKYMEPAGKGSIVNVASIGGVFGSAGVSYSAAKAGVIGLTKNVAIQFAGKGIRCNAVNPGPTPTELNTDEARATFDQEFMKMCGKHMNPDVPPSSVLDQAYAILYFACDESAAVTGQSLIIDRGKTL